MPVFNSISGGVFFVRNAVVKFGGGCSVELSLRGFSAVLSRAEGEGKGGEFSEGLLRIFAETVSCSFFSTFCHQRFREHFVCFTVVLENDTNIRVPSDSPGLSGNKSEGREGRKGDSLPRAHRQP